MIWLAKEAALVTLQARSSAEATAAMESGAAEVTIVEVQATKPVAVEEDWRKLPMS